MTNSFCMFDCMGERIKNTQDKLIRGANVGWLWARGTVFFLHSLSNGKFVTLISN